MLYARAVIVEFMGVDAFISIFRPRDRGRRISETLKSYQYLSLRAVVYPTKRNRACALEAILAVLMVCIIHIGEPNRIGIPASPSTMPFLSISDVRHEIRRSLKKNPLPF